MNRLAMLPKLLAFVTLLVLSATACGSEADQAVEPVEPTAAETVDTESLADELKQQLEAQTGTTITTVDCPTDVQVEAGSTFECTAEEKSGTSFTIEVTLQDDQDTLVWGITHAST